MRIDPIRTTTQTYSPKSMTGYDAYAFASHVAGKATEDLGSVNPRIHRSTTPSSLYREMDAHEFEAYA